MLEHFKKKFHQHIMELQDQITAEMKRLDAKLEVIEDSWERTDYLGKAGGGGLTRAFLGDVFENAGVNTSLIDGAVDPQFANDFNGTGTNLWATGISLIIHPRSPRVPTVHANFRMIHQGEKFWFGGGADLTPFYPYEEDFSYFHRTWAQACAKFGNYETLKHDCDLYFRNLHRNDEMRGVGGIFFDHLNTGDLEKDFQMVIDLSNYFIKSYFPIVEKRHHESWTDNDEDFQLHRRGRYVEFNLIHDRGTLFGLKTNGRTDSILISLPKRCKFTYKYAPQPESIYEKMSGYYYPRSWL